MKMRVCGRPPPFARFEFSLCGCVLAVSGGNGWSLPRVSHLKVRTGPKKVTLPDTCAAANVRVGCTAPHSQLFARTRTRTCNTETHSVFEQSPHVPDVYTYWGGVLSAPPGPDTPVVSRRAHRRGVHPKSAETASTAHDLVCIPNECTYTA